MKKPLLLLLGIIINSSCWVYSQDTFTSIATGDWGTAGTWSGQVGDADGIPDADDAVIITGGFTVTVSSAQACISLDVGASDFNGSTLTVNAGFTLTVTNNFIIDSDALDNDFDFVTVNINGTITVTTGVLDGDLDVTGSTIAVNVNAGGILNLNGTGTHTITSAIKDLGAGQFALTVAATGAVNQSGNILIHGQNTTADATDNIFINIDGTWTSPAFRTRVTGAQGEVKIDLDGTLDINGNLTFVAPGTGGTAAKNLLDMTSGGTVKITGNIAGPTSGTIDASTTASTWELDGTGAQTVELTSSTIEYCNLTLTGASAKTMNSTITTTKVLGNITINTGANLSTGNNNITHGGNWTEVGTGSLTQGTATVDFAGTAAQSISGTVVFTDAVTISNTTAAVDVATGSAVTFQEITFAATSRFTGSESFTVTGNWTNNGATTLTFTNDKSVTFNGGVTQVLGGSSATTFQDIIIDVAGTVLNISVAGTSFEDVTIQSPAVLDPDAVDFIVTGNWTNNNGTAGFTPLAGSQVTFTGDAVKTIGGTGSTDFQDLNCNLGPTAARTLTFNTACQVFGVLDVTDGQIVTGGLLTLNSDGTATAAIADLSDGSPEATPISGNVIAERFINEGGPEYYLLASPLTNATFEDWNGEFYMTGFTGTDDPANSFKSVITRDEVLETWPNPANTTETITNGTGYMCYIGDDGIGTNLPKTLNITGTVKTGGFTTAALPNTNDQVSTLNNDGWHLLGNPYACPIIWDNVFGNVGTVRMNATAMRKLASGAYAAIPAGGTVASGEAFWVFAENLLADGAVEFQENDKSPVAADGYNTKHIGSPLSFNMILKQGTYEDSPAEVILTNAHFNFPTSTGYDIYLDAAKKTNQQGKENLATLISNNPTGGYIRNYIPDTVSQLTIPIRVWKASPANINKTYSIDFNNVAALYENNKCLSFEDTYAGISFPLTTDTTYTVSMNDTTYVPRFFIHVSSPIVSSVTNISCNSSYGFITATGTGSGPFNYIWKNQAGDTLRNVTSSATDTLSNLGEGIYYLTVANNGSCGTVSDHFELTSAEQIVLSGIKTDIACYGDSSGSAQVLVSGGNSPFSYAWSNGENQAQISNLKSQVYFVTVTDAAGCSNVDSVTITQPGELFANPTAMNLACFGDSNGSATVLAAGGSAPYTYSWNSGENTSSISGLSAAVYYITVTDNSGCTKSDSVSITQPDALVINPTLTNVLCNGGNSGQASINVSGGTSDYTYLWSNGEITAQISNLISQNYTVTVTDANNCSASQTVNISQPPAITITSSLADALCYGSNDGMAAASPSGGTPGYTFLWSTGGIDSSETALPAGNYSVTITDNNNCSTTSGFIIDQPDSIALSISTTNVSCNGENQGQASVFVAGGIPDYAYAWSSGGITAAETGLVAGTYTVTVTDANNCYSSSSVIISEPLPISFSFSTADATCGNSNGAASVSASGGTGNLTYLWNNNSIGPVLQSVPAGNYAVTITDQNSCSKTGTVIVNNLNGPSVNISSFTDVSCYNGSDGSVTILMTGGSPPFNYQWDNGALTQNQSGLTLGNYVVTVTDMNGCKGITSITINEPSALSLNSTFSNVSCQGNNDGSADVTVTGGSSPYTYLWNNSNSTQNITSLAPGNYSVTVTDNKGCNATANFIITEPDALTASPVVTNVACYGGNDGSIVLGVSGGSVPYTYLWNNGEQIQNISSLAAGNYSVTITDNNNCIFTSALTISEPDSLSAITTSTDASCGNSDGTASVAASGGTGVLSYIWSNGATTPNIGMLPAGNYTVTVIDENGCSKSLNAVVNNIDGPTATIAIASNVSCYGGSDGSADVSTNGGTPPYSYLWSNGSVNSTTGNVQAGNYTVTVSDALGCAGIASILIVEPSEIIITGTTVASTCGNANGGASIMVIGGTGSYAYEWVTGDSVPDINNVAAGNYTVTVTDQNNCSVVSSITISDVGGPSVNVNSASDASCNGGSNGQVTASASGGTAPYAYLWSNGSVDANISSLAAGTYILTVTDANNCAGIISVEISEPAAIAISSMATNALCGNTDGTASVSVIGGTQPYSYSWSNGESVPAISNLAPGNYYVLVSDANGCSKMATVTINNISGPALSSPTLTQPTCYGFSDGAISYSANGNGPFNYTWQNATGDTLKYSSGIVSSDLLTNLPAGDYSLIVSDNNGCISATTIVITQPAEVSATFTLNDDTVDIAAGGTISITNSSFGAVQYTWSFGDGSNSTQFEPDHSYNTTGVYTVMLTAAQGQCADTTQQVVVVINSVGIPEGIKENAIKIVQHGEKVIVQYNFSVNTAMTIELYNIIGQNILQGFKQEVVAGNIEISLPEATGIYFLKVKTERGEHIHKIFR